MTDLDSVIDIDVSSDLAPPVPSIPVDTCHHALFACPHATLVALRHTIFLSWADLLLSNLPFDFVPVYDNDLDPDALASSLSSLHTLDDSCVLLPATICDFIFSPAGPFRGAFPPRAVSAITSRLQPLLVKGLYRLWHARQALLRQIGWDNASRWAAHRSSVPSPSLTAGTIPPLTAVPLAALLRAAAPRGDG